MMSTPPPQTRPPRPFPPGMPWRGVTRLRVGRLVLLLALLFGGLMGGTVWLLRTQGRRLTTPAVESSSWPAWMKQASTYPTSEPLVPKAAEVAVDPLAGINAKLAQMLADMQRLQAELDALKKRPSGTTMVQQGQQHAAKVTPPPAPHASMAYRKNKRTFATATVAYRKNKRTFATATVRITQSDSGKGVYPACFLRMPSSTFLLVY